MSEPHNPLRLPRGFGLFRVRSPLLTESHFDFLSYGYLDVSVPRVGFTYLCIQYVMTSHDARRVSPFGHLRIYARVQLPVAFRRFPRPSSPPGA